MTHPQLEVLRKQLDQIDQQWISLLAERFRITDQIGIYKSQHDLAAVDTARERSQIERINKLAEEYGLDPRIPQRVIRAVIAEVVKRHKAVRSKT